MNFHVGVGHDSQQLITNAQAPEEKPAQGQKDQMDDDDEFAFPAKVEDGDSAIEIDDEDLEINNNIGKMLLNGTQRTDRRSGTQTDRKSNVEVELE